MLQPNLTNLHIFKIGKTLVLVLLAEAGVTFPRADISQLNVPRDKAWDHCKSLGEPPPPVSLVLPSLGRSLSTMFVPTSQALHGTHRNVQQFIFGDSLSYIIGLIETTPECWSQKW